jgi:hypothetical protein
VLPDEGVDTCIHDDDIGCTLAIDEDLWLAMYVLWGGVY